METMDLFGLTENLFQGFQIDDRALLDAILAGKIGEALNIFGKAVIESFGRPIDYLWDYFIAFFMIGIGAVVLKQLQHLFENTQIQKTSRWIIYLILSKQLLVLYYTSQKVAESSLERLIQFGKVFVPTFSAALTLASGKLTGAGYIATLTLVIYIVEQILLMIILPLTEAYMLLSILGGLWEKERVEHILNLLEKGFLLSFKAIFAVITGIGLLQSMILPFVDHAKVGAAKKLVNLIPGVGNVSGTTLEIITGSAVLLKNGVGVIGILLMLILCLAPLIKVGMICVVMKLTAIVYGLLEEKNMTWCADKLSMVQTFLFKIIGIGLLLFVVWILLAVYTTNQRLWT